MITQISIRSIQHYLYCPHRWGLLEIDKAWAENAFVTKANLMHERVHDPDRSYTLRGKAVFTSVSVFNDNVDYGLYGVTDCIEATEVEGGVSVFRSIKKYELCIVEYKPAKPKTAEFNEDDAMQVFAQKICVDNIFNTDCSAQIYYADVKRRTLLPFNTDFDYYNSKLKGTLSEMRHNIACGIIPPIKKSQNCSGCSMKEICLPKVKTPKSIKDLIESEMEAAE